MNKIVLTKLLPIVLVLLITSSVSAQQRHAVFPILNRNYQGANFVEASVYVNYSNGDSKAVQSASVLNVYKGSQKVGSFESQHGNYISFEYVTDGNFSGGMAYPWNHSSSAATQFAFYPGGIGDDLVGCPLYAFVCDGMESGLRIVNVETDEIVARLSDDKGMNHYTSLTVFSGGSSDASDIIVVAGEDTFLVFDGIPSNGSGVRSVTADNKKTRAYGLNGMPTDGSAKGVTIVTDGNTTKKVIKK